MNTDNITTLLARLGRIGATLQTMVERQSVKNWYTTEDVATSLGRSEPAAPSEPSTAG